MLTTSKNPSPDGLLLYDFGASPCARRCRITLLEKGLRSETQPIDLSRLEQRSPEYLEINPNGFVPTLAHGERVIFESNVITEYLDDAFPDVPLYPDDPWERAQVKMWQGAEAAMAKDYRTLMYQRVMGPVVRLTRTLDEALEVARRSTDDPADLEWERRVWSLEVLTAEEEVQYEDRLVKWLERLDRELEGKTFLVGERFSQADISVYPRVMMFPFLWIPIDERRFPNVARWAGEMGQRGSFDATLSEQDRGLARLSSTPIPRWMLRTLKKPEGERNLLERFGLVALRKLFESVVGGGDGAASSGPIRKPQVGEVPPSDAPVRRPTAVSADVRDAPLTLYDDPRSPHGRRVRIALLEKGLRWHTERVDIGRMAQKAPGYLKINPNGEVPALRHGDRLLADSLIIAEYLDQVFPDEGEGPLFPRGGYARAEVRMWLALEAGTHKEFRPLFFLHVVRPELLASGVEADAIDSWIAEGIHPSYRQWLQDVVRGTPRFDTSEELARSIILTKLERLESALASRLYLVGDHFTMADAAWITRVEQLADMNVVLAPARFPHLLDWQARVSVRPSVRASGESAMTQGAS